MVRAWGTVTGEMLADRHLTELQVMLEGIFELSRFLTPIREFIFFDDDSGGALAKETVVCHQFYAVRGAAGESLRAVGLQQKGRRLGENCGGIKGGRKPGDRPMGVVWHTQDSVKCLTMAFCAGAVILELAMANTTVLVLTDRNDLDDQLFGTFSHCQDLLRQPPTQADSHADLRNKLSVNSGA